MAASAALGERTPYELLGGEAVLRQIVGRFYDLMDETPEYHAVRKVHGEDLSMAREKLFGFLSGWLGGPPLYVQKYGNPMLRARHLPFAIGRVERDQWLACMRQAVEESGAGDTVFRAWLLQQLFATADWMRNKPGDGPGEEGPGR